MTIRPITIFYSWQSDLPSNVNRSFIEEALSRTTKDVKLRDLGAGDPFSFTAAVDRDTRGHLGTPDIAATIFSKIEGADIFVADVSIVSPRMGPLGRVARRIASLATSHEPSSVRATPNPNVMAELGFAAGRLGWDRVVCVCNEAYGAIEELPFDLRGRSVIPYRLGRGQAKGEIRKELVARLKARLVPLFQSAWEAHRPHPLRFAVYDDIALPMNRFLGLLAHLHVQSRAFGSPTTDWSAILSQENMQYTLEWSHSDASLTFAGGITVKLVDHVVQQGAELRGAIGKLLSRYGDRLPAILYEALHHLEKGLHLSMLEYAASIDAVDVMAGRRRPRILAFLIQFDERDLRALLTIADWCEGERAVLSRFEPKLRPFTPPAGHAGTPGVWRIDDLERQRQLARWDQSTAPTLAAGPNATDDP